MTQAKMKILAFLESLTKNKYWFIAIFIFLGCKKTDKYSQLSQLEIAKWHVYQNAYFLDKSDCKGLDIYNYTIDAMLCKNNNNNFCYRLSIKDENGLSLYEGNRCKFIYQIEFQGNSPKIKSSSIEDGLEIEETSYRHYVNNKNAPMYKRTRASFMEDTLAKDTLYLQRPRKKFVETIIENKNTADKWLLEMACKLRDEAI